MATKHEVKLVTLLGTTFPKNKKLSNRIDKIKENATLSELFNEISTWEKESVREFRGRERTNKSGKLCILQ